MGQRADVDHVGQVVLQLTLRAAVADELVDRCLLYTSDAADERSSVDLGGRRIIKKKNSYEDGRDPSSNKEVDMIRTDPNKLRKT